MKRITTIFLCLFVMVSLIHAQKVVPMLRIEKSEDGTIRVFDMQGNEIKDGQTVSFDSEQAQQQQTTQSEHAMSSSALKMMEDIWESTEPEALKVREEFFNYRQSAAQLMLSDVAERTEQAVWEILSDMNGAIQAEKFANPENTEIQLELKKQQAQHLLTNESVAQPTDLKSSNEPEAIEYLNSINKKIEQPSAAERLPIIARPLDEQDAEAAEELERIRANAANNVTLNPGPNLTIDTGVSYYSFSNPTLTTHIRVINNGTSSAGYSYLGYYLSTNNTISTGDTKIGEDYVASLSAGGYSDEDETIDLRSYLGTWYVGFYVDHTFLVAEDNENDNAFPSSSTITVSMPNLTADAGACSFSYNSSTTDLTYNVRVINNGNTSSGASYLGYYLSTNTTITTSDYRVGEDYVAGLAVNGYSDKSKTIRLSSTSVPSGTYYVCFIIDYRGEVSESNEDDNAWYWSSPTISYTAANANLAPVAANCSFSYTCPNLSYNIRIENKGSGSAAASYVGYYVSTNDIISTGDYLLGEDYVAALSPGSYSNEDETFDLSTKSLPNSVFWVGFVVDYKFQVSETDENDNYFGFSNEISHPCPNLTIDTAYTSMSYSCPTLTYNVRVINNGAGPAPDSRLGYYLSTDTAISTSDFYLGEDAVGTLAPGGYSSESETFDLNTKSVPAGTWYVAFIVDHREEVSESNGGDNAWYFTSPITYPCDPPDLSIEGPLVGGVNKLTWSCPNLRYELRIKNIGANPAGSSYVGYYLSDNTIISTSDFFLGESAIPALNPAQYVNVDVTFDLSTKSLAPGSYYAGFIIDYKSQVAEKNENNNIFYWDTPKIDWPCIADLTCLQVTLKSGSAVCREAFYIRPTIKNEGGDAGSSHAKLYLSTDNDFDISDDTWIEPKKPVPALARNASATLQWDFTFPYLGDGAKTVWVLVHVDCDNEVVESNESNIYKQSNTISYNCASEYMALLVPNGHEAWMPNSMHLISWDPGTVTGLVRLHYSTDAGVNWRLIEDNLPNTGCYRWTVPNTVTQKALVRVQSVTAGGAGDPSDENFTIGELPLPYIMASSIGGKTGEKVVDILIKGNTRDIAAFGLTLTYDPAHLAFVQVDKGSLTQNWIQISGAENIAGEITIGGFNTVALPVNSVGSLAKVKFNVTCSGCTECSQSRLIISNLLDHVQGMNIGYGVYSYSSPCPLGDVNMDGNITPADALCAFQIYLNGGKPTPGSDCDTECALVAADANCNSVITPEDALIIFRAYLDGKKTMECPIAMAKESAGNKELVLNDIAVLPGEEVQVPIRVNNTLGLSAFGASLAYPADVLEYKGYERSDYTAEWLTIDVYEAESGFVRFGGFDPAAIPRSQETILLTLLFVGKEKASGSGNMTIIDPVDDLFAAKTQSAAVFMHNIGNLPESFGLAQNYPNPFNMKTEIVYRLTETGFTEITVVDIRGNHVRTLVRGNLDEGIHRVTWDGYSDQDSELATGIYFAILKSGSRHASIKMALIK